MRGARSRFTIIGDADLPDGIEWVVIDLFGQNPYAAGHPHAKRPAVEIITDPNDRRGFDARPVRAA